MKIKTSLKLFLPLMMVSICAGFLSGILHRPSPGPSSAVVSARAPEETFLPTETVPSSVPVTEETVPPETEPQWFLPVPQNIPAGPKNAAVSYRIVHQMVYAAGPLYVRSGPGSQYPVIGRVEQGQQLPRGAIGNNGWSQILVDGQEAWTGSIRLSVAPIAPAQPDPDSHYRETGDVLFAREVTKLRSGPSLHSAVIGHLTQGTGVDRIAIGDNGWSRIIFHDTEAYAITAMLTYGKGQAPEPCLEEVSQQVFVTSEVTMKDAPSLTARPLGTLPRGLQVTRTGIGNQGWDRITYEGKTCYVCGAFLSLSPLSEIPAVETSLIERPTPNAPFFFQYVAPENVMPFGLFMPAEADPSKPLPLILSLHGALEIGESPETLKANFITKEFRNWEYTGLKGFDAYIVCPQLTGYGYNETWRCQDSADKFFALIRYLLETYNIDESRISIEGHSLGGQGALYMAADPRACFSAVVPVSAYEADRPLGGITAPVRGYTGSPYLPAPREDWDSFNFMKKIFFQYFGPENFYMKNCSHYDIPMVALEEDSDSDGNSDLISWMLSQQRIP